MFKRFSQSIRGIRCYESALRAADDGVPSVGRKPDYATMELAWTSNRLAHIALVLDSRAHPDVFSSERLSNRTGRAVVCRFGTDYGTHEPKNNQTAKLNTANALAEPGSAQMPACQTMKLTRVTRPESDVFEICFPVQHISHKSKISL